MNRQDVEAMTDTLLGIKTSGRDDSIANTFNFPYEPTPYSVLNRLCNAGYIKKQNVLLDYGCGKGRVDFYISHQIRCHTIGIDYDERMIQAALHNQKHAVSGKRVSFYCENAVGFSVPKEVDRIYFFNPFSVEILEHVLARIKESYFENLREIQLYFYYPSDEYIAKLMCEDEIEFEDEISCKDMFNVKDNRERIMIFKMGNL